MSNNKSDTDGILDTLAKYEGKIVEFFHPSEPSNSDRIPPKYEPNLSEGHTQSAYGPIITEIIPKDILAVLFGFLDRVSLIKCELVCKTFRVASVDVWETKYKEITKTPGKYFVEKWQYKVMCILLQDESLIIDSFEKMDAYLHANYPIQLLYPPFPSAEIYMVGHVIRTESPRIIVDFKFFIGDRSLADTYIKKGENVEAIRTLDYAANVIRRLKNLQTSAGNYLTFGEEQNAWNELVLKSDTPTTIAGFIPQSYRVLQTAIDEGLKTMDCRKRKYQEISKYYGH